MRCEGKTARGILGKICLFVCLFCSEKARDKKSCPDATSCWSACKAWHGRRELSHFKLPMAERKKGKHLVHHNVELNSPTWNCPASGLLL